MEPAAARIFEDPANDEVWYTGAGLPVEYSSIDMFDGIWSLQPYVPSSSSRGQQQQQLVENNFYAAATQHHGPIIEKAGAAAQESLQVDMPHDMKLKMYKDNPIQLFKEADDKLKDDIGTVNAKIHRYPLSIQELGEWYTIPRIVAIGPYHHWLEEVRHTENVKHVAAYHCINKSGRSVQEMYDAVVYTVEQIHARRLYSKNVMEGTGDDNFLPLMFLDACFLVMYMRQISGLPCDSKLYNFFESNTKDIAHDIMLLENQIPWPVVEAVMKYTSVPLEEFIANWKDGCLQDRADEVPANVVLDDSYKPPHLLGLLRFHIVRRRRSGTRTRVAGEGKMKSIPFSVSAIELAEMGINLRANETKQLADMGLTKKRIFFGELSMAPLSLDDLRASLLVNMAALELCTTPEFFDDDAEIEDSAVCSYLLLCMLVHRKEDVHQLRSKSILKGGAGLSKTNALKFFTNLQSLRLGRNCGYVMVEIESYRIKRKMRIKVYTFFRNNLKTILGVLSAIGAFAGILSSIKSLKGAH
ncbi:unnamed protein product [Urochloa humidicola]